MAPFTIGLGETDELHVAEGANVVGGVGLGCCDGIIEGGSLPNRHALLIRAEVGVPKDAPNSKPPVSHFLTVTVRFIDVAWRALAGPREYSLSTPERRFVRFFKQLAFPVRLLHCSRLRDRPTGLFVVVSECRDSHRRSLAEIE